jgi:hypothetical protein
MDGHELPNKEGTLQVTSYNPAAKKDKGPTFTNLYVKNFPCEEFDEHQLVV